MSLDPAALDMFLMETPKTCQFCKRAAEYRCNWRTKKPVQVEAGDLVDGDIVLRGARRFPYMAEQILRTSVARKFAMSKIFKLKPDGDHVWAGTTETVVLVDDAPVLVLREVSCWVPVCERHVQERTPTWHVCADHWDSWKEVA